MLNCSVSATTTPLSTLPSAVSYLQGGGGGGGEMSNKSDLLIDIDHNFFPGNIFNFNMLQDKLSGHSVNQNSSCSPL